ncbi:hypothetical protein M0D48_10430 [Xanthomonas prunicola]|uniref:hypothetical protein n=1 Tax=Xanthomonas prunicola TaxID=2053930 RepID=UPI0021B2AF46|nr:hypothetical protein [Xanthomonas prunicola]UXA63294.1 hypothetical protein M0D48_10430 [Xanthomonas prunicola]
MNDLNNLVYFWRIFLKVTAFGGAQDDLGVIQLSDLATLVGFLGQFEGRAVRTSFSHSQRSKPAEVQPAWRGRR